MAVKVDYKDCIEETGDGQDVLEAKYGVKLMVLELGGEGHGQAARQVVSLTGTDIKCGLSLSLSANLQLFPDQRGETSH